MWTAPLLRLGIAVSLAVTLSLTPLSRATKGLTPDDGRPPTATIEHKFGFRNQSDADLTEWALARFDRAGLVLPPLVISFHDDRQVCGGNFGLYRAGAPASVDICGFNWDRFIVTAKKTVLHEFAHAWTHQTLSDQAREQFLALRDLDTWGDDEAPWEEQGSEQAAEIIAWALIDEELQLATISNAGPEALTQAYAQLTGFLPFGESVKRSNQRLDVSWVERLKAGT